MKEGNSLPDIKAALSEDDKEKLTVLLVLLMRSLNDMDTEEDVLYKMSELRIDRAIRKACSGFGMDQEEVLKLINNIDESGLSDKDIEKRNILIAAIANIIEFGACEEYQLAQELPIINPNINLSTDWWDSTDEEFMEPYLSLNQKYNGTYADVEDADIEYAMAMAAVWVTWNKNTMITYMTQNDDRVRPWHYVLQGFTASRDEFPAWMIPPIEWACRCYLVIDDGAKAKKDTISSVVAKSKTISKPKELDGVFKESVCKCGRIFSDEHPYFQVNDSDKPMLNRLVERLRRKYYG